MSESLTEPEPDVVQERSGDLVADWWSGETTGQPLYMRLRKIDPSQLQDALDGLPDDDGPQAVPTPDRAPPRAADMPEVQALRAHLQDHKTPFDTIDRWFRAITMMTQALDGKRPLQWTADDVARRCIQQAGEQGGSIWSTLEAVREFWRWHPDRAFIDAQQTRLQAFLRSAITPSDDARSNLAPVSKDPL